MKSIYEFMAQIAFLAALYAVWEDEMQLAIYGTAIACYLLLRAMAMDSKK